MKGGVDVPGAVWRSGWLDMLAAWVDDMGYVEVRSS